MKGKNKLCERRIYFKIQRLPYRFIYCRFLHCRLMSMRCMLTAHHRQLQQPIASLTWQKTSNLSWLWKSLWRKRAVRPHPAVQELNVHLKRWRFSTDLRISQPLAASKLNLIMFSHFSSSFRCLLHAPPTEASNFWTLCLRTVTGNIGKLRRTCVCPNKWTPIWLLFRRAF